MAVQNMSTTASIEKVQGGANNIDTTPSSAPVPTDSDHGSTIVYLQGIRFMMLAALLVSTCLSLLTIITTHYRIMLI